MTVRRQPDGAYCVLERYCAMFRETMRKHSPESSIFPSPLSSVARNCGARGLVFAITACMAATQDRWYRNATLFPAPIFAMAPWAVSEAGTATSYSPETGPSSCRAAGRGLQGGPMAVLAPRQIHIAVISASSAAPGQFAPVSFLPHSGNFLNSASFCSRVSSVSASSDRPADSPAAAAGQP